MFNVKGGRHTLNSRWVNFDNFDLRVPQLLAQDKQQMMQRRLSGAIVGTAGHGYESKRGRSTRNGFSTSS